MAAGLSQNAARRLKMGSLSCLRYLILRKFHRSEIRGFFLITFSFWDTPEEGASHCGGYPVRASACPPALPGDDWLANLAVVGKRDSQAVNR